MFLCVLQQCDEEIVRVNEECLAFCKRYPIRFGVILGQILDEWYAEKSYEFTQSRYKEETTILC